MDFESLNESLRVVRTLGQRVLYYFRFPTKICSELNPNIISVPARLRSRICVYVRLYLAGEGDAIPEDYPWLLFLTPKCLLGLSDIAPLFIIGKGVSGENQCNTMKTSVIL